MMPGGHPCQFYVVVTVARVPVRPFLRVDSEDWSGHIWGRNTEEVWKGDRESVLGRKQQRRFRQRGGLRRDLKRLDLVWDWYTRRKNFTHPCLGTMWRAITTIHWFGGVWTGMPVRSTTSGVQTPMTRTPWRALFFRPSIRTSSSLTRFTLMTRSTMFPQAKHCQAPDRSVPRPPPQSRNSTGNIKL